jgi:hypothetical protein
MNDFQVGSEERQKVKKACCFSPKSLAQRNNVQTVLQPRADILGE